ncbi:MAG: hypothetical protein JKY61_06430 [Planctomycetes bacterium]|nr:hypothetical protein [Planctomycetota bacterium]
MKLLSIALLATAVACQGVKSPPSVNANLGAVSQYNFRGVPQNEKGAVQSDLGVSLPTDNEGTLSINVWSNWDLSNDSGDAVLPSGNGGKLSEIDLTGSWSKDIGGMAFEVGLISYNFPNAAGGSTTEIFASFGWDKWGLSPGFTLYHDFDQVDGSYLNGSISKSFTIDESTSADLSLGLGFTDKDHASAYYGAAESGLSDLLVTGSVGHQYNERTSVSAFLSISQILDSGLEDAVEAAGMEAGNTWAGVSVGWSF